MGYYRNHPGGMGGMSENVSSDMKPVYLDDLAAAGNRAQRRFAKKKIADITRKNAKAASHGKR